METASRQSEAIGLMSDFAHRTGLTADAPQRRYLWTDAYAVRNFLDLFLATGDAQYRTSARDLIGAVHETLGRHRTDDPREGWLSGLSNEQGARHPTRGGLRIGKPQPERARDEPPDDRLEWDQRQRRAWGRCPPPAGSSMPSGRAPRSASGSSRSGPVPRHREVAAWQDHRDINDVMLATVLLGAGEV